jgi:S1-C subfamily serine protease
MAMHRRQFAGLSAIAAVVSMFPSRSEATLVPPIYLDCVVALGFAGPGLKENVLVARTWHTTGTGFFYGHLTTDDPDPAKRLYSTYLVTAKHVVDGYEKIKAANPQLGGMRVRVNPISTESEGKELDLINDLADPGASWMPNPSGKDVAVIPVNLNNLRNSKYQSSFFPSDQAVADTAKLRSVNVSAGDGVFVLGFPMDLAGMQKNYVIVRHGIIARVSELLDRASDSFLIDAFVFPGNSGGPVILRPEIVSITGTQPPSNVAYLIGVVVESVEWMDAATSNQTGRTRIVFEENSGLARVIPMDYVTEAVMAAGSRPH